MDYIAHICLQELQAENSRRSALILSCSKSDLQLVYDTTDLAIGVALGQLAASRIYLQVAQQHCDKLIHVRPIAISDHRGAARGRATLEHETSTNLEMTSLKLLGDSTLEIVRCTSTYPHIISVLLYHNYSANSPSQTFILVDEQPVKSDKSLSGLR